MKILVACEFSGVVREAFRARGHNVVSCDLLPSELPGLHYQGDVRDIMYDGWDMMIAFPPCTYLCVSGARWFKERLERQKEALNFVRLLMDAPISKIAIENPVGVISTYIRKPDQIIQPYYFGHNERKKTCLWLKNLPPLVVSCVELDQKEFVVSMRHDKDRSKNRSRTFNNVALAMANQWG